MTPIGRFLIVAGGFILFAATLGNRGFSATQPETPKAMIEAWQEANSGCRGGTDPNKTEVMCDLRDEIGKALDARGWCYGKQGQAGYQMNWHSCKSNSNARTTLHGIIPESESAATKESAEKSYNTCLLRSMGKGDIPPMTMQKCVQAGISWCNVHGIKTSPEFSTSPITGAILIDNPDCAQNLEGKYIAANDIFRTEFETYAHIERFGGVYRPIMFDIRQFVGPRR